MKFLKFAGLVSVLVTSTVFAHDLKYSSYLRMQESLASDDMKNALSGHKEICEEELKHYKDNYKDCNKTFKDIEELRTSFKKLSELYIQHGDRTELKSLMTASCPMAKAKWLQTKGSIRNPYYGKSMLECGQAI